VHEVLEVVQPDSSAAESAAAATVVAAAAIAAAVIAVSTEPTPTTLNHNPMNGFLPIVPLLPYVIPNNPQLLMKTKLGNGK
jgi:hypothetical protein